MTSTTTTSPKMMTDLGKLLRHNFRMLAGGRAAGTSRSTSRCSRCRTTRRCEAAVDAINLAIEGLPDDVHVSTHICQGNYAVGKEYDAQIGHRYFDVGRYKADLVCKIECSSYLIEYDMTHHYEGLLGNRQLGVGAVDVQDPKVETGETVAARIRQYGWLAPEQTIVTSSCGFNHLPRQVAFGKLQAMVGGEAHARRVATSIRAPLRQAPHTDAAWQCRSKHVRRECARAKSFSALAQEAGRLGIFEWQVQDRGGATVADVPCRSMALTEFDGRYETWLNCIFREDRAAHRRPAGQRLCDARAASCRPNSASSARATASCKWIEARSHHLLRR